MLYGNARDLHLPSLVKLREPRSFQTFIRATSRNAVSFAKAAAKTLFPASNSKLGPAGMSRMTRATTSNNNPEKSSESHSSADIFKPDNVKTIVPTAPLVNPVVGGYPVYAYQPSYVLTAIPYYGNAYQQVGANKRSFYPYNFVYNYGQFGGKTNTQSDDSKTSQDVEKANPVNIVSKETDGFSKAVVDMKEAVLTKNVDGGVDMEEKYHDQRINTSKKDIVNKNKKGKNAIETFKRVLERRGSLESQLADYLTNYVCGSDC